ncbi:MAG TPA: OB-fold domain-containing protein [Solirubrobacterales bacterium]|nr:OB-fold domain-containing protein [Solirubrobacterales bacterium]
MEAKAAERMEMRGNGLGSTPGENPTFDGRIELPYTLTTGKAAATFLAELANKQLVGSRCSSCGEVAVPAQDFCAACGESLSELVVVAPTGELTGFTETAAGVLGTIRLDGADADLVHKLLDVELDDLAIGTRVEARWAAEPEGNVMDIEGFAPSDAAPAGPPRDFSGSAVEPVLEQAYELRLEYDHAFGPYYGTLFDGIATSRRIQGVRCPSCDCVLVPPREYCDTCFCRTAEWVDVKDTGTIKAFSIIYLEFVGQTREPPYVYAEIVLDGTATRLIHSVGGIDVEEAKERLRTGMKVKAVWKDDEPTGSLEDIEYFEPIFED